jgi:mycothiol system anti-sigma-R factor
MKCGEIQELLTAYVDGEVTTKEKIILEDHLGSCTSCTTTLGMERSLKTLVHEKGQSVLVPQNLRERIGKISLEKRRHSALRSVLSRLGSGPLPLYALAAAALVLFIFRNSVLFHKGSLIEEAILTHRRVVAGEIPLEVRTQDATRLSIDLAGRTELQMNPMVHDLQKMGFYLEGGGIIRIADQQTIYTMYKGHEHAISCFRLKARPEVVPRGTKEIPNDGRPFRVFRQGETNALATWESESDLCIRVSDLPPELLAQIARDVSPH